MEKSNIDKIKDVVIYAPLGVIGFIKENAPTLISLFVARGKSDNSSKTRVEPKSAENIDTEKTDNVSGVIGKSKPKIKSSFGDMTSDIQTGKDVVYSAVGALSFVKDNFSMFGQTFANKGKKQVNEAVTEKTKAASEKISKGKAEADTTNDKESLGTEKSLIDQSISFGQSAIGFVFSSTASVVGAIDNKIRKSK